MLSLECGSTAQLNVASGGMNVLYCTAVQVAGMY